MDDEELAPGGKSLADYATYEDFLSSQVTKLDLDYLEDVNLARKLVELGYRGAKEGYSQEQFIATKAAIEAKKQANKNLAKNVLSFGQTYEDGMLRALQQREESNRTGKMCSIFFIRDWNEFGQEISGYVDYSHRLSTEDFEPIFNGKKKFLPKRTDLSFFNWETMCVTGKNSPNYEVIANSSHGMLFRNKRDNKIVNVDPKSPPGDNSSRTVVSTNVYINVIIFDHYNRRKS